jgi:hypothetical protein
MRTIWGFAIIGLFFGMAWGKDTMQVQVVAAHSVTHEDRGARATLDKGILGSHVPTKEMESFNLDTIINGEHVLLACDDPKGCESPGTGNYEGELKRSKWIKLRFALPLSHKEVSRWYKISGSW